MSKTAVIYWSGTGNTEAMAQATASAASTARTAPAIQRQAVTA